MPGKRWTAGGDPGHLSSSASIGGPGTERSSFCPQGDEDTRDPAPAPLPACRGPRAARPPSGSRPLLRTAPRPGGGRPPPVTLGRAGLAGGGPSGLRLCRGVGKRLREGLLCWRRGTLPCPSVPCPEPPPRIYLSLPPLRAHYEATLRGNYLRQRYGRDYRRGEREQLLGVSGAPRGPPSP